MVKDRPDTEEFSAGVRKAIISTMEALGMSVNEMERIRNLNNLVFYGWAERHLATIPTSTLGLPNDEFKKYVDQLKVAVDVSTTTNTMFLDTLCRGLDTVDDPAAGKVAFRVVELLRTAVEERTGLPLPGGGSKSEGLFLNQANHVLSGEEMESLLHAMGTIPKYQAEETT